MERISLGIDFKMNILSENCESNNSTIVGLNKKSLFPNSDPNPNQTTKDPNIQRSLLTSIYSAFSVLSGLPNTKRHFPLPFNLTCRSGRLRMQYLICQAGLLMVVLDCVGHLTQRFPHLTKTSLDALADFLLNPNPVLSRLNKQICRLNYLKVELMNSSKVRMDYFFKYDY